MNSIKGYDKLMKQLDSISNLDELAIKKVSAQVVLEEMKDRTPVDTGELLESEHLEITDKDVSIVADAPHAIFVEYGTVKQQAQPFMRPALEYSETEVLRAMKQEVESQLKEILA